jgi:hypothetical protein
MKNILIIGWVLVLITSCIPEPKTKSLTYQNIVILSDMSSRITNKPQKDLVKIKEIINFYKNECVKPGKKIGDRSSLSFSTFSNKSKIFIDIDKFENLAKKQRFVNSTGEYTNSGLAQKIYNFEKEIISAYAQNSKPGLDLISVLIEKIEKESIIKKNKHLTNGIDTTFINFENHINIFTDGYLEYKGKNINDQYYFGIKEINKIRILCKVKKLSITEALKLDNSLKLPAAYDNINNNINLHILETHQRDKNDELQNYNNPKGLRDNEILEEVWRIWAKESGFKSFEWKIY